MKKKIVSIAVMLMMAFAIMPIQPVLAQSEAVDFSLKADRTEPVLIEAGKSVTMDLAGYNIDVSTGSAIVIQKGATLTINDTGRLVNGSLVYGTVTATGSGNAAVAALPGSFVYINGGTFRTLDVTVANTVEKAWYPIKNMGTMVIDNATVTTTTTGGSSLIDNGWVNNPGADNVDTVAYQDAADEAVGSSLTINGGTFTGNYPISGLTKGWSRACVKGDDHSTTVINGGTYSKAAYVVQNNNYMTISGGTFSDAEIGVVRNNNGTDLTADAGILTINAGTFTSTDTVPALANESGNTTIYGGSFNGNLSNGTATGTTISVLGGTYMKADGTTINDVSTYVSGSSKFDAATGKTTTEAVTTITKYVQYTSNPGATTFTYTLTNVNNNQTGDTVVQKASTVNGTIYDEVRDGIAPANVKLTMSSTGTKTLNFSTQEYNAYPTIANLPSSVAVVNDSKYYLVKDFKLDFTGVTFANPGIFRYVLKETSDNSKVLSSGTLFFDVWVSRKSAVSTDAEYNEMTVTAIVAHTSTDLSRNGVAVNTKTSIIVSPCVAKSMNLTVKHYALGNQASKTENYKYTLTINNATHGSTISYVRSNNTTGTFTILNDGTSSYDFYLKDKEAITFLNISEYPGYKVIADEATMKSEDLATATQIENYQLATKTDDSTTSTAVTQMRAIKAKTTTTALSADTKTSQDTSAVDSENEDITVNYALADSIDKTASTYAVTDRYLTTDTTLTFSIYKQGTIPTGVILSVAPYAVVVLAGFFGLIVFAIKRRDKDEEEA